MKNHDTGKSPIPSRLDLMIDRLLSQRAALDWGMAQIAAVPGVVVEFGLGNGRSFDHLRRHLPDREIYVFDRAASAHPDSTPAQDRMILGDFRDSAPQNLQRFRGRVALLHADTGSYDHAASRQLTSDLSAVWAAMLCKGGVLLCDQGSAQIEGLQRLAGLPEVPGTYALFRRAE